MELFSVDRIEENIVILIKDGKAFNYPLDVFDFSVKEGMLLSRDSDGKFRYEKEETERVKSENILKNVYTAQEFLEQKSNVLPIV